MTNENKLKSKLFTASAELLTPPQGLLGVRGPILKGTTVEDYTVVYLQISQLPIKCLLLLFVTDIEHTGYNVLKQHYIVFSTLNDSFNIFLNTH